MDWDKWKKGLAEYQNALAEKGVTLPGTSIGITPGTIAGARDLASVSTGGMVAPSAPGAGILKPETRQLLIPPTQQMAPDPSASREGGAVQDVGPGAQRVDKERVKPKAEYVPAGPGAEGGPADNTPSLETIMRLGPRGSAGGWQRHEAEPVTEAYANAFTAQGQANVAQTNAAAHLAQVDAQGKQNMADTIALANEHAGAAEARRQQAIDAHFAEQQKLMDDVRQSKIDPDQVWSGAGGALRRIGAVFAMAMGGYAAGLRGGPNQAADIIDKMVDRDVDAQKTELAKKQSLLQQSNTKFGQMMQKFGDERAAAAAMKADLYAGAQAHADAMIADAKTDQQRAQGEALRADLMAKRADHVAQVYKYAAPTTGMSALQAIEIQQRIRKNEADTKKTEAETENTRATAEKTRREAAGDTGGNPDLELAQRIAGRIGKDSKGASVDIMGVGRVGGGDKYGMWRANLRDAAKLSLKLRGQKINDEAIKKEQEDLFGDGNDEAVRAGMAKIQEIARIKGGGGKGSKGGPAEPPDSFEE